MPALSSGPAGLPAALAEAAAASFGPVNTYLGALNYAVHDVSVNDAGKELTATRTYRSNRLSGGDAGPGWFSSFSEALSDSNGVAALRLADGGSLDFATDPAAGYTPAPGMTADYVKSADGTTITTPDQLSYQFDALGELTGMNLGDDGHHVDVQRLGGQVAQVTGVSGRYLAYARSDGRLTQVSDSAGRSVALDYVGGRLDRVTGVDGHAETYTYDGQGRLTRVTTPMGRVRLAAGYQDDGRVAWIELQGEGRTNFAYDDANRTRTVTLADGTVISQEYDGAGREVTERIGGSGTHTVYDGDGRVVTTVAGVPDVPMQGYSASAPATLFDQHGDPVLQTDPTGVTTRTSFNSRHEPLVSTRTDGSTITRTYDEHGRLTSVTDPRGGVWTFTFNDRGQVTGQTTPLGRTSSVSYASNGDTISVTDGTGATTTFEYDSLGRRTAVVDALGNRTQTAYTAWDEPRQVTRPRGGATTTTFDDDRQPTSVTKPVGPVTGYEYDAQGRLSAMVDAVNHRISVEYDSMGRPITVTDARGGIRRKTYTAEGWLATETDPANAVTSYSYDPVGRAVRATDALGQVTQTAFDQAGRPTDVWTPDGAHTKHVYDAMGRKSTITTARGFVWTYAYDLAGDLVSTQDPLAFTTQTSYDAAGRVATTTNQLGTVTTYTYDDDARTVTVSDPLGTVQTTTRDAAGRVASVTDGRGGTVSYAYDGDGKVITVTDAAGSSHAEYDLAGQQTASVDPVGRRTTAAYDAVGNLRQLDHPDATTESFTYDAAGNLTERVDRTDQHWAYAYDSTNHLTTVTDPLGHHTTYTYDPLGRETSVTDATGVITRTAYDPVGRVAVQSDVTGASWVTHYDLDGNIADTLDPDSAKWTFTYTKRDELASAKSGSASAWTYTYDAARRLTKSTNGYTTTYEYDVRNQLTAQIDGLSQRTTFTYDLAGNRTSETLPSGNTTTWSYDLADRLVAAADALGNQAGYGYNAASELTSITLPRGGIHQFSYDNAGRLHEQTDPTNAVTTFGYDAQGRLTSSTLPSGKIINATYDTAGRQTSLTAGTVTRTFGYDDAGRLISATSPGSSPLTYTYDNLGLLALSTDALANTSYTYDAAHRLTSLTPAGGPSTTYTYNDRGLLATVRGSTNQNFNYNTDGQIKSVSATSPTQHSELRTYDSAGRLARISAPLYSAEVTYTSDSQIATVSEPYASATNKKVTTYSYDEGGHLLSAIQTQNGTTLFADAYTWDADGNRASTSIGGQSAVTATYDLADRLLSTSDGITYSYNPDGQLSNKASLTWAYNDFGELASAANFASSTSYTRDALGRIAARQTGSVTTSYSYGGPDSTLSATNTGTGPVTALARTPDGTPLAEASSGVTALQAGLNLHGDLVGLKDDTSSTVRWTASYDPFGVVTATTGSAPVPLGYQAGYTDPVSGLIDMAARAYDPTSGQFTTADTVVGDPTTPVTLNRYLYGGGDPVNHTDPSGHCSDVLNAVFSLVNDSWCADWDEGWNSDPHQVQDPVGKFLNGLIEGVSQQIAGTFEAASVGVGCAKGDQQACDGLGQAFTVSGVKAAVHSCTDPLATAFTKGDATAAGSATAACGSFLIGAHGINKLGKEAIESAVGKDITRDATTSVSTAVGAGASDVDRVSRAAPDTRAIDRGVPGDAEGLNGPRTFSNADPPAVTNDFIGPRASNQTPSLGCKGHSFDPDTPVVMADGTTKPIKDVKIGDRVKATDPTTGSTQTEPVTALHINQDSDLTDVTVQTSDGRKQVLHTTQHHPFWDETTHSWTDAATLTPGDGLHSDNGAATVTAVSSHAGQHTMRDLTVSDVHTYYVVAGTTPVLVHNCDPARFIVDSSGSTIDRASVRATVSAQKQNRHVAGTAEYRGGGYFNSADDAQAVLDAFHSGSAEVMGVTRAGHIQVRFDGVTGYNNNPAAGFIDQATNIFMIKGSSSPSVVPISPLGVLP